MPVRGNAARVLLQPVQPRDYRRLEETGEPGKVGRIAAARKLLLLAYAIYKSGEPSRASTEEVA